MPIDVIWDNRDQRVVRHIYTGHYTPDEVLQSMAETDHLRQQVSPPAVDIIIEMQTVHRPDGIISMRNALSRNVPEGTQTIIMVGAGTFLSAINAIMSRLIPELASKFVLADSPEEAQQVITLRRAQADRV